MATLYEMALDDIKALLARAEKAERERDVALARIAAAAKAWTRLCELADVNEVPPNEGEDLWATLSAILAGGWKEAE